MNKFQRMVPAAALGLALFCAVPATAQHAQVSAVAPNPNDFTEVWVCNRDNATVSVVDTTTGTLVAEIPVGKKPRSLAFSADGSQVFVANKRGNVPFDSHFVTPFSGTEVRGSVSVIDVASKLVTTTLDDNEVGVEPYGVAVAPNGAYFAVTAFRSGWITFFDAQTLAQVARHDFQPSLNFITSGTVADLDENKDGLSDAQDPRGFTIQSDSSRIYVTHNKSPYVSILDLTLDGSGLPSLGIVASKLSIDDYAFHPIFNPINVQTLQSQGTPRFMEDVSLSPDGSRALIPHVLHNVNHDVNFDFTQIDPTFAGDFANRVYPSLTMIDAAAGSFNPGVDNSARLHHELSDDPDPAAFVPFGTTRDDGAGNQVQLGGVGPIVLNQNADFVLDWTLPAGWTAELWVGRIVNNPQGPAGTMYSNGRFKRPFINGTAQWLVPPFLVDQIVSAQAVIRSDMGQIIHYSNPLRMHLGAQPFQPGTMGHRAGQPSRVLYNAAGDKALMLNRGSEDVFLYDVNGSQMTLHTVYPERALFSERTPFDLSTPLGDLPIGMALVDDPTTANDDSLLYVMNEITRSLSVIRVNWTASTMYQEGAQIPTFTGMDVFSQSVLVGNELFEDASRAATTGNFNNSCASCHFEGGEDANVWQRPAGPRSTMPVYGGSLLTGLILWKGVRLNMGETGPMFGGENGGHGMFSDAETQGLIDYHNVIAVPLNPNFDLSTSSLTPEAAMGQDLFFGDNNTGTNPTNRRAGCATCHPKVDDLTMDVRGFTADFMNVQLTDADNLEALDPFCVSLQENIVSLNIRNINSAVNVDSDLDGFPDIDRNVDGWPDIESYVPLNPDTADDFTRDDQNGYLCPDDPAFPQGPQKLFTRDARNFSIPTKLGVFSTPPYMHDHSLYSLRTIVDPSAQMDAAALGSPIYGMAGYNDTMKYFNEFHDIRAHEDFVQGASKVQLDLQSTDVDADIDLILAFIQSL